MESNDKDTAVNKVLDLVWNKQRPWKKFFERFEVPKKDFRKVMEINVRYYYSNYLFICLVFLLYFFFTNPWLLVVFLLSAAGYIYLFFVSGPVIVNGSQVPVPTLRGAFCVGVFILLAITGTLSTLILASILPVLMCALHSILRHPSIEAGANKVLGDVKGTI